MAPRGLSADQKVERLLNWFYEKKGVFTLKELEGQAAKETGISQSKVKLAN